MSGLAYILIVVCSVVAAGIPLFLWVRYRQKFQGKMRVLAGQVSGLKNIISDLQEEKQAAQLVADWQKACFRASTNIVLAYDTDEEGNPGKYVCVSDAACKLLEYTQEDLRDLSPLDVEAFERLSPQASTSKVEFLSLSNTQSMPGADDYARQSMGLLIRQVLKQGLLKYDGNYVTRSGRLIPASITAVRVDVGPRPRVVCFARDVTSERAHASEELDIRLLLRDLMAHAVVGVAVFDRDKHLKEVNSPGLKLFGCPDVADFRKMDLLQSAYMPNDAKSRLGRGESFEAEIEVDFDQATKDAVFVSSRRGVGHFVLAVTNMGVERDFSARGFLVQIQDVTPLREVQQTLARTEDALRQARKMEAMGTLAGGIAHDFNNILTPIMGYAELAQDLCAPETEMGTFLKEIMTASMRAKQLVEQILVFSRRGEKTGMSMALSPVLKEVAKQLSTAVPPNINVSCSIRSEHDQVLATPTQIHQVLMNLCSNAAYVMRDTGGALDISLSSFILSHAHKKEFPNLTTREYLRGDKRLRYVRLTVKDAGPGMDEETIQKIFEPFFTTKPSGEGTGMGLALVQGIVSTLAGSIRVDSKPGEGTAFHVAIPCEEEKKAEVVDSDKPLPKGSGRVLFVDDEIAVTRLAKRMLTSLGYDPVVVSRSKEALDIFERDPQRFDLVVTDQVMPEMTGAELTAKLLAIRPDLPIVLCTGFSEKFPREAAEKAGIREFVMKPILRRDLGTAIEKALAPRK